MLRISMLKRALLLGARAFARTKPLAFQDLNTIKLRSPITPTHKNFDVSPDHPLWAFFPEGSQSTLPFRLRDELDTDSREWTFAELRRKSFDDLHVLWYKTLRDRNVLAREVRLAEALTVRGVESHNSLDEKLISVQKKIKQVLLERQAVYERVATMTAEQEQYLNDFEHRYVEAGEDELAAYNDKLVRLQYALFGIEPQVESQDLENDINVKYVQGVEYIARVKLGRFIKHNPDHGLELPLNGIMEQVPFLLSSAEQAIADIKALREANLLVKLPKSETFAFLRNALQNFVKQEEK